MLKNTGQEYSEKLCLKHTDIRISKIWTKPEHGKNYLF